MKIINNGRVIKLYLNELKIDFSDNIELENYFRKLFLKLKRMFNMSFTGLYDIDIYLDQNYGSVIELKKEELEYIDYYDNEIDMRIAVHDVTFLYEIHDIFEIDSKIVKTIYYYKDKFYLELNDLTNKLDQTKLMEMGNLTYQAEDILRYGKKIIQVDKIML